MNDCTGGTPQETPLSDVLPLTAPMAFGTFSHAADAPFPGVQSRGRVLPLSTLRSVAALAPLADATTVLDLMQRWPAAAAAMQAVLESPAQRSAFDALVDAQGVDVNTLKVHAPIQPRQIFMSGANYFKHVVDLIVDQGAGANPGTEGLDKAARRANAEEMMRRRQREGRPYFFVKPITTLTGPNDPVILPAWAQQPDWELELAVVIGRPARHVRREDALSYVAGYTVSNDLSNRDHIFERGDLKGMGTNWVTGKSCPTYLPIGPVIVPAAFVPDPQALRLRLTLNGQVMQDESTSDMIFDVARQIEYLSSVAQLLPGDILCTGSPAGNGTHYNRFLRDGDQLECSISGLGTMRNPVQAERV